MFSSTWRYSSRICCRSSAARRRSCMSRIARAWISVSLQRVPLALDFDHQAHALTVTLVAHVRDAVDLLVADQFGDPFLEGGLVDLVGQLVDDDREATGAVLLDARPRPYDHPTVTGCVGVLEV